MRPSAARLAAAATASAPSTAPLLALLPPVPLYRRLLRAHRRHLPAEMRLLGDQYVKAEFRAHRAVDNPAHLVRPPPPYPSLVGDIRAAPGRRCCGLTPAQIGFLTEWQLYAQKIEGDAWAGERLDPIKVEKLSGESYAPRGQMSPRNDEGGSGGCWTVVVADLVRTTNRPAV